MVETAVAYCRVRVAVDNPCSGKYTSMLPAAIHNAEAGSGKLGPCQLTGVALKKGTYRVTFERVDE